MKKTILLLLLLLTLQGASNAQGLGIGSAMDNFSLPGVNGTPQTLAGVRGQNGTVIMFLATQCGTVRGYKDRINQIAARGRAAGVGFVGVISNTDQPLPAIAASVAEAGYQFPVVIDRSGILTTRLAARTAPEVYFLDREDVLIYRGAIDNDPTGTTISSRYLADALDAAIAGKPVMKKSTQAPGCRIDRAAAQR